MAEDQAKATAHFDADEMAAAQVAPTLRVGGYLYRGRLLSIEEWLPWWERLLAIQAERRAAADTDGGSSERGASFRRLNAFYRDYLRVVFPRRRYRWWAPDPVKHLMRQPFTVVEEAIAGFFFLQARATFGADAMPKPKQIPTAPPGTDSLPATATDQGGP